MKIEYDGVNSDSDAIESRSYEVQFSPAAVYVLSLLDQAAYIVPIGNLSEARWARDSLNSLVLHGDRKALLTRLVNQHQKKEKQAGADFVRGKGNVCRPGVVQICEVLTSFSQRASLWYFMGHLALAKL